MRPILTCSVIVLATTAVGCGPPFTIPAAADRSYTEVEPNDSASAPNAPGFELDGTTWFELRGTFADEDDADLFRITFKPGVTRFDLVTYRQYQGAEQQYNLVFPINVNNYSGDTLGTQQVLAAAGWGADIEAGATHLHVKVSGKETERFDSSTVIDSYTGGKPYRVLIR